jgi:hypothetical protein
MSALSSESIYWAMTPKALEAGLVYYLRLIEEPGAPNSRNTNFDTLRIPEKTFEEFEKALQMLLESFHDALKDSE